MQKVIQPSENLIYECQKLDGEEREKAKNANKSYRKKRKCSKQKTGEEVFIWYGNKNRKKVPKERFIILGEVIKIGKNEDMYNTKFRSPVNQVSKSDWFSAKDMADFKKKLKDNKHDLKRKKQQYQKSILIRLSKEDRLAAFLEQGYSKSFDPPGNDNCQFFAIAHALSRYAIYRSAQSLQADIVRHLENNPNDRDGVPLELFMGMPFSDYLVQMARDGTDGDQLTLRAASGIYNIQFTIISTLGESVYPKCHFVFFIN